MGLISAETVRRCLRGHRQERFVAFVSALWRARGGETRVVDRTDLVVTDASETTTRLRVVVGTDVPQSATDADVLVLSRRVSAVRGTAAFEGRIIDAEDIHGMLLYAISRSTADDLCRQFFDRPLETDRGTEPTVVAGRATEHSVSLLVGLVGLSLLVASVFGGPLLSGETTPVFGAADSVGTDSLADVGTSTLTPTPTGTDESSVAASAYPPGLGPDGVVDHDALADAHATAVTGQSYRLTLTHREYVGGEARAYRRETVYVAEPTVYRSELTGAGTFERGPLVISAVEAYADGETRFQRRIVSGDFDRTDTVWTAPVQGVQNGEGRYADRVEQYVGWFLSVSDSEIVDVVERGGTRYYWVRLGEDPYPGVENSTGSALIDENGVVHEITRQYEYPSGEGVSAMVSVRYTDIGTTTVSPPVWLDEPGDATNATTDGTPETTTTTGANTTVDTDETTTPSGSDASTAAPT